MSKHYCVFQNATGHFLGYLPDKATVEIFKSQRNMDSYNIVTLKEKKLTEDAIWKMHNEEAIHSYNGYLLFPGEEEIHYQQFDVLRMDIQYTLKRLVTNIFPYVKFSQLELETVNDFLKSIYLMEKEIDTKEEEDEVLEYEDYYNMNKMIEEIIKQFGG